MRRPNPSKERARLIVSFVTAINECPNPICAVGWLCLECQDSLEDALKLAGLVARAAKERKQT